MSRSWDPLGLVTQTSLLHWCLGSRLGFGIIHLVYIKLQTYNLANSAKLYFINSGQASAVLYHIISVNRPDIFLSISVSILNYELLEFALCRTQMWQLVCINFCLGTIWTTDHVSKMETNSQISNMCCQLVIGSCVLKSILKHTCRMIIHKGTSCDADGR